MIKLIINADDCGNTITMNEAIRDCIEEGIITSTSVMAVSRGGQFLTACKLYKMYFNTISFGAHLNLTSGVPLTTENNSLFLKTGFCQEKEGKVVFNGMRYRWKYIPITLRQAIYEELEAQLNRIENAGIVISHIDSHQHIHYSPWMMPIFCKLAEEHGVKRIRRPKTLDNYDTLKGRAMMVYNNYLLYHMRHLKKTEFFFSVEDYMNMKEIKDGVYKLMCHPGHDKKKYQNELLVLKHYVHQHPEIELITYNDL